MTKTVLATALLSALLAAGTPALALAQAAPSASAQGASASQLVLDNSTRILSTLDSRRAEFKANPAALKQFIKSEFDQAFDADYAARLVLGIHGRGASPADVDDFAAALADNLTSRYGTSLLDFNSRLQVKVKSETPLPGNRGVRVSTQMLRQGQANDPVPVDFLLRNVGGQWKIFDVMVEGISYVQTFKNQFDGPLSQKSIRQVAADLRSGRLQASGNSTGGNGN